MFIFGPFFAESDGIVRRKVQGVILVVVVAIIGLCGAVSPSRIVRAFMWSVRSPLLS